MLILHPVQNLVINKHFTVDGESINIPYMPFVISVCLRATSPLLNARMDTVNVPQSRHSVFLTDLFQKSEMYTTERVCLPTTKQGISYGEGVNPTT